MERYARNQCELRKRSEDSIVDELLLPPSERRLDEFSFLKEEELLAKSASNDQNASICPSAIVSSAWFSNNSSENTIQDSNVKSGKHTATTRESLFMQTETNVKELVTASAPLEREIFLISKLKKREPRRSFDISDLRKPSLQSLFAENNNLKDPSQTSSEETIPGYRVEKSQIGEIYNRAVDNGRLMEKDTQGLSSSEKHILSALLKLRLTSVKSLKPEKNLDLSADLELINQLLKSSVLSKKRTEELLKKNFKTTLKVMLDNLSNPSSASQKETESSKAAFLTYYFRDKASQYEKIFKCIQLSKDHYKQLFSFPLFREHFLQASREFLPQFIKEREHKTQNLISNINSDLMSSNKIKPSLRTPWSIQEAQQSQTTMMSLLQ